jgi:phosphate/sulfate permease
MANPTKLKVDDPRALDTLFDALKQKSRGQTALVKLTRADAVALTGLPNDQAEPALKSLVATYRSHLAVTDEGELVYEFDPSLERRDKVPLGERLAAAGQVAWRGFQMLFKIWIVVTLVAYVVAFLAMMISMMVARSSDDRDDRRGGGGFPWLWFWLMPDLAPPGYGRDPYGRQRRPSNGPKKRFYLSVFDFVFGPKTASNDPREADKRLLAFLRDHKGRVTAAELTALSGLSLAAAEEELTRLMVEYDGEVEVADDGTLLYVFEEVLPSASAAGTRWTWAWDNADPVPALTGNTPGTDGVIGAFAGFNLLASMTIGPAFLQRFHLTELPWTHFFVTLFPLIFSAIFFAVPAARWAIRRQKLKKRARRQLRRELLREIWSRPGEPRDPAELTARAAERTGAQAAAAQAMLDTLVRDLDGDVTTDEEGRMRYVFTRLDEEQRAVAKARAATSDKKLGEVIFSSEEPGG